MISTLSTKWKTYEMPELLYQKHPAFCEFLESTPLLNQIKVTRDRPFEYESEPALIVEGVPMKWTDLNSRFEAVYSKRFDEQFIVERDTRDVFTYLDDGNGLQKHHPYLSHRKVISKRSSDEILAILKCAQLFIRPQETNLSHQERLRLNQERVHVLQIVSSWWEKGKTNFHRLIINPQHPYIRLVIGKDLSSINMQAGEVYEVGYRSKDKITFPFPYPKGVGNAQFFPFLATQGVFRSPDAAEYASCDGKVVTNICVTESEAEAFYKFTEKYHRESINLGNLTGFHYGSQNCTTYVRKALLEVGIAVPSEISGVEMIQRIAPQCFESFFKSFRKAKQVAMRRIRPISSIVPQRVQLVIKTTVDVIARVVKKALDAIAALPVTLLHLVLGDAAGNGGQAFVLSGEPPEEIKAGLSNWKKWFLLSNYRFHVPGILQEWQLLQLSTLTYAHPVQLTI